MKKLLLKTMLLLCALVAGSTSVWADDEKFYTLTPTEGTNSAYADACDVTVDGITWNLTGNSKMIPWRIGGKSLSKADRALYSKTAISENVSKIEVTHGAASSITVTNWTLIVSKNSDFSNPVSELTPSFKANATTTINRPDGKDWSNCYFKFIYRVTVSGSSNKFVEFSSAAFYKETGSGSSDPVAVTGVSLDEASLNLEVGGSATLTATVAPGNADNKNVSWESDNTSVATVDENGVVSAVGVGDATITVTTEDGSYTATCDVNVTKAAEATLSFDFTDAGWEFPSDYVKTEASYTNGGYTFTLGESGNGHKKLTSGSKITALIFGKSGATLVFPAFPFNVEKIKVYGESGASGSVTFNIFVGEEAVSDEVTSSKVTHDFAIAAGKQSAGTIYTLKLTNANNCQISKIEVFGYKPVTISEVGYATLFTPVALDFSGVDGLTAYTAVKGGDVVRLTQVNDVPENTGVVLEGAEGTYSIPAIATSTTAKGELTGNATAATAYDAESDYTYYVLADTGSGVEFRPVDAGEIAAGKAFLKVADVGVHNYTVVFGDETGISETVSDVKSSAIYDLSGRRVVKPTKGLYIVNGKKIMVK